jgi:hypothetical protein
MNGKKVSRPRVGFSCIWLMMGVLVADQPMAVLTNLPPSLNGKVVGDLQVNAAQTSNYNSYTTITGTLVLPGTPDFNYYAGAVAPPISEGDGQEVFDPYEVSFNGPASVGGVVTRTDQVPLAEVREPTKLRDQIFRYGSGTERKSRPQRRLDSHRAGADEPIVFES